MKIGLRIDVDTFRGTKIGVPNLCRILSENGIAATFFFSVGPDNMGRHLFRLLRPTFLWKMMRTRAASLYGWEILMRGTVWPGPLIGKGLRGVISDAFKDGHEIGFHAWDHHYWQANIETMDSRAIRKQIDAGVEVLTDITGQFPVCSAAPGWKCNDSVLVEKAGYPFVFNSDCRGQSIFRPIVNNAVLPQPQIPVTLPTYDEVVGNNGISEANYNDYLLSLLNPDGLNVLTIHAEVEGIVCSEIFRDFINKAHSRGATFVPLGNLLTDSSGGGKQESHYMKNTSRLTLSDIPGREGWVACQETDANCGAA